MEISSEWLENNCVILWAVRKGEYDMVENLLDDPTVDIHFDNCRAIEIAIRKNNIDILKLLLNDIIFRSIEVIGKALNISMETCNLKAIDTLIKVLFSSKSLSKFEILINLFKWAMGNHHNDILLTIMESGDCVCTSTEIITQIVNSNNIVLVNILLDKNYFENEQYLNILLLASQKNNIDIALIIAQFIRYQMSESQISKLSVSEIDKKCCKLIMIVLLDSEITTTNIMYDTICTAIKFGFDDIVEFLLDCEFETELYNADLIVMAGTSMNYGIINILLKDPRIKNISVPPVVFMDAVKNNDIEIVKILCDTKNIDKVYYYDALLWAWQNDRELMINLLMNYKGSGTLNWIDSSILEATSDSHWAFIRILLNGNKIDVCICGKYLIKLACKQGNPQWDIIRIIASKLEDNDIFVTLD